MSYFIFTVKISQKILKTHWCLWSCWWMFKSHGWLVKLCGLLSSTGLIYRMCKIINDQWNVDQGYEMKVCVCVRACARACVRVCVCVCELVWTALDDSGLCCRLHSHPSNHWNFTPFIHVCLPFQHALAAIAPWPNICQGQTSCYLYHSSCFVTLKSRKWIWSKQTGKASLVIWPIRQCACYEYHSYMLISEAKVCWL